MNVRNLRKGGIVNVWFRRLTSIFAAGSENLSILMLRTADMIKGS